LRKNTPAPATGMAPPLQRQHAHTTRGGNDAKIPRRAGKWLNKLLAPGVEICYCTHLNKGSAMASPGMPGAQARAVVRNWFFEN
jgi:hypothetical protein